MAHTYTDTGLSALLGIWPRNGTNDAVAYVGLFSTQTSGTVPNRTAFGGASPGGWTEVTGLGYARQVISAAQWGAGAVNGNGYRVTGIQVAFTATGGWAVANGFLLANKVSSQAGDVPYYFANFDSLVSKTLVSGDILKLTPGVQFNVSALS